MVGNFKKKKFGSILDEKSLRRFLIGDKIIDVSDEPFIESYFSFAL